MHLYSTEIEIMYIFRPTYTFQSLQIAGLCGGREVVLEKHSCSLLFMLAHEFAMMAPVRLALQRIQSPAGAYRQRNAKAISPQEADLG